MGGLLEKIAQARVYHRVVVVEEASVLNIATATKLSSKYGFERGEQVQELWVKFLKPSPWPTLLSSCLEDVVSLNQALCAHVFTLEHRQRWRDEGGLLSWCHFTLPPPLSFLFRSSGLPFNTTGLFSGVMKRLHSLLDVYGNNKVSFEVFLQGAHTFMMGSQSARNLLAFRFFDLQNQNVVSL